MRKILLYIVMIIVLVFLIPVIFTREFIKEENIAKENKIKEELEEISKEYNYEIYNKIKLLHVNNGEIEEKDLDEYVCEVVSAEMPVEFEEEALKAQAVVARTYTIYKIMENNKKHGEADICDSSKCCQAWISKEDRLKKWNEDNKEEFWKKIEEAVYSTKGKFITYEGKPINAFFHANSGGKTEIPYNVWGGIGYPYLASVETNGESNYSQYASEVILTKEEFVNKIKELYSTFEIDFNQENCIEVLEYTDGNRIKVIKIGNLEFTGVDIRNIIGLKSANFKIELMDNNLKFSVIGYGHGVGMSQTGADSLAKEGKNYEEIIKHFYQNVEISNI